MSNAAVHLRDHPLMAEFVASHGAVVKSPAGFARSAIKEHASTQWALDLDPDATRIMTFMFSAPPARPPYPATVTHALTLTEALLQRYQPRLNWLDNGFIEAYRDGGIPLRLAGELLKNFPVHTVQGIYGQSSPQVYDASTHVNIPPARFKAFIKHSDLRQRYQAYLKTFWAANGQYYPLLAKAAFLKAAFMQTGENSLRETDRLLALRAAGLSPALPWSALTPAHLQASAPADSHLVVAPLKIHRYSATDILLIKDSRAARVLLYIPGNSSPLHGFEHEQAMAEWLAGQCRDRRKRELLEAHFKERDDHDGLFLSGLHTTLRGVAAYPHWLSRDGGTWPPRHFIHSGANISGDPFVFVRDSVEQRLSADARSVIRSNGDARLEGIAEGLERSLLFTGLIALIVPEAVPLIVGLSVTLAGTGAVQAAQGQNLEQRLQGLHRAEFGLWNALPIVAEKVVGAVIAQADAYAGLVEPAAPLGDTEALIAGERPEPFRPRFDYEPPVLRSLSPPLRQSLRGFEASPTTVQGPPTVHGPHGLLDIHHVNARYFLALHDKAYEVRWEEAARRWRIISPDGQGRAGPYVRQLDNGQWDIEEGGLRGGMESPSAAPVDETPITGLSPHAQVRALYPGFSPQQVADLLAELRANGTCIDIQLARLATEFRSLERSLERWASGPLSWGPRIEGLPIPVSQEARRRAADVIRRCWQRQTPVEGVAARHISGYMLTLDGVAMGDLPYLPGDFSHVTAINLARTFTSHQSISALLGKCPNLRWLNLEHNFLTVVPAGIRGLPGLTRLTLAGNRIALSADMLDTLGHLSALRLLNLENNPLGALLDVSAMPNLVNLFLRNTGLRVLPAGVCELNNLLALDLRGNLLTTLPEAFFAREGLAQHCLLDGNPLSPHVRGYLAMLRVPVVTQPEGHIADFWLGLVAGQDSVRRRDAWDLFWTQAHAADFFEVIARQEGSADFEVNPRATAERVWQVLEAGAQDEPLRGRLIAMAAHPQTCSDGAAVMFSNMELEVLVSRARAQALAGRQGPPLLQLLRGLYRLEEVDALARADAAARTGFVEDVEVMLAYRAGLAERLSLPVSTRAMVYADIADVSQQAIDRAAQTVLVHETPEQLAAFALKREFWVSYLESEYPQRFVLCQQPTAQQMEILDDRHSLQPMTDAAYKDAADAILRQRRLDEAALLKQLTLAELERIDMPNEYPVLK